MKTVHDTKASMTEFLGENYFYLKTIASNTLEIKKLELMESSSKVAGNLSVIVLMSIIALLICQVVLALIAVLLFNYFGSWSTALFTLTAILIVLGVLVYLFGKNLIQRIIQSKFEIVED